MDVVTPEQAVIAQEAGAVAVMALERIPADIRAAGGVARMSAIELIQGIMDAVTIPVMAKVRIGHFAEAQVLQSIGVDYIDESEVLTPADDKYHVDKHAFTTPFVCGARDLGEALRRIAEGAAMIRSKGEAGSGNIVEAVRHIRAISRRDSRSSASLRRKNWSRARAISARRSNWYGGRRERQASGRAVLRGRRLDAGRCRADDAARRRRHLRRQRHLQVEEPEAIRQSDRGCDDALQRSEDRRGSVPLARHCPKRWRASTCAQLDESRDARRRAETNVSRSAYSRCRATSSSTSRRWSAPAPQPIAGQDASPTRSASTGWSFRAASRPR